MLIPNTFSFLPSFTVGKIQWSFCLLVIKKQKRKKEKME